MIFLRQAKSAAALFYLSLISNLISLRLDIRGIDRTYPFRFIFFLFHVTICIFFSPVFATNINDLKNLDYSNKTLQKLRAEIKYNLKVSKSSVGNDDLMPLEFYRYVVTKDDNFFKIMAKTGMDIDTISSVNSLSSPQDIRVGMKLLLPNMRGIYNRDNLPNTTHNKKLLSEKYNILEKYILYDNYNDEWFIPGKVLEKLEKAYFYGMAFMPPLDRGRMSSGYGSRIDPFTKKQTFHGGIDIAAVKDTPVIASAEGDVLYSGKLGGYGKLVVIKHIMGYETRYGHLNKIDVKKGEKVKRGEVIGYVGNTGRATGYHLHFEVRRFSKNEKPKFNKHM